MMFTTKQFIYQTILFFLHCWVWVTTTSSCVAQDSLQREMIVAKRTIKFSPLHLIGHYPTVQFAYEQRLKPKMSVQIDLGVALDFNGYDRISNKRGIKIKTELKYYFSQDPFKNKALYLSGEPYINAINYNQNREIVECFDLDCNRQYAREVVLDAKYREVGMGFKFGFVKYHKRFLIDMQVGFMVRWIDFDVPWKNEAGYLEIFFPEIEEDLITVLPTVGFRIGRVLSK